MKTNTKPNSSQVLATALKNLKTMIDLTNQEIGEIIGLSRNTITRFFKKGELDPNSKPGELSLLLIRAYRALFALNGSDREAIQHWLRTNNRHIQGIPLEQMKSVLGLSRVVNYLDAIRGKI